MSRGLALRVVEVLDETADARSLVFEVPPEQGATFDYLPGQFLTLKVPSERTGSVARCYSMASSPYVDARLKVTVKRTADGYASNWLCDHVAAGDELEVLAPAGVFTPPDLDEDLVLLAAGSGVTPVISILKSVLAKGTGRVALVYANRDETSVIFGAELRDLVAEHPDRLTVVHWLESVQGLPRADLLAPLLAPYDDRRLFTCGPAPFMDAVREAARSVGMPRDRVHAEVFTSLSGDPFAADEPAPVEVADADAPQVAVEIDGAEHQLRWPRATSLVDVLLSAGVRVPFSCREGECGSCAATLTRGEVDLGNAGVLDPEDIADGIILTCQARPLSDELRVEF
ncbi:ferredoxin--NADP reductase [Nocardioides sp. zg-536]|uniref:Ferredoxin--NADP reductase n=1 Tax=Nocardioides faecalis TaxID=2803858 RepID=A0A938Y4Y2_9ACTN|nr:ferredoxin--NADP reductase [Nocardioides faecalis]MBM9458333.1 ferredoxin--NADP reductase [Nocardioides faecalis]QVI58358.1 ferredoxin--NADP reductase [Nocardioides faecalis]